MSDLKIDAKVLEVPPNTVHLTVSGFLDSYTSPRLKAVFEKLYSRGEMTVIVDMRDLLYISSTGIGTLMGALSLSESTKGAVKLCNVPEKIMGIISMLGFDQVLSIYSDLEEARKS